MDGSGLAGSFPAAGRRARTVIMFTHRFTTAHLADEIHVMSDGRIIESGTSEQLLAMNAQYAEGWS